MGIDGKPRIQRTLSDTSILKSKRDTVDRYNNRLPIGPKNHKSLTDVPNLTQRIKFGKEIYTASTLQLNPVGYKPNFNEEVKISNCNISDSSQDELNFDGTIYKVNVGDNTNLNFLTNQNKGNNFNDNLFVTNKIRVRRKKKRRCTFHYRIGTKGTMNYRGPSRTTTTNYYLHDAWMSKKGVAPKRESPQYLSGFYQPQYFDTPTKYRTRQRAISPNLPRLPYLERSNLLPTTPVPRHLPKNTKVVFKNRVNSAKEPVQRNDSKKSIPDHTLMKTLLSGLSIFDSQSRLDFVPTKQNVHNHKSMGNIKTTTKEDFSFDVYPNPKSSVDFTELQSRKNIKLNLKEASCSRAENVLDQRKGFVKPKYQLDYVGDSESAATSQQCFNGSQCFRLDCESGTIGNVSSDRFAYNAKKAHVSSSEECLSDKFKNRLVKAPPNKLNIVQERKKFFENKKLVERGNFCKKIAPPSQQFIVNCVQNNVQKAYGKPDEITEIYRNFQSVHSTSTISKRSSSVPPVKSYGGRSNPRNVELFNPDYNFDNRNRMGVRKSLIGSIRSKVFQSGSDDYTYDTEECHGTMMPRFPKETRTAMSIILSNRNSNVSCRYCQERIKARQVVSIETQTSPVTSKQEIDAHANDPKIPCTKNLLCDKGHHSGRCEKIVREKLNTSCTEGCVCRSKGRMIRYENLIWPGHPNHPDEPVELHVRGNCEEHELFEEEFLKYIRVDMETSTETIVNERNGGELPVCTSSEMNGLNGHSNGDLNGCGDIITQNQQRGCWTIGLINSKYRYLTAETFGFKINANGTSLKKKQIWTLEPDTTSGNESFIFLKSHLDKYLAVDSFGNVTCEGEEKEAGSKFQITVAEDSTGRWAFRNVVRGYFLGSSSDKLTCTAKVPGDAELWHIHLAARPQVNLRSVGRKRFAHLSENLDEIHVDANIPWGEDTLFTLEFHADESGKYALHTCNNKYLSNGGKLVETCTKDCLFSAEYHSGQLALRDRNGAYLSPIGSKAVLKTRSNTVTKDELFSLEDSLPQASFVAALNARYVSVKQGVDVTANQDEISDHETFQLEFDWSTKRWYIRTMQDKYWTLETGGGIQASGDKRSSNALFDLAWQDDGSLAFRANNGRYVITKRSGHLYATSDAIDDNCKYFFYLINRPILVLKCEQGFVGYKSGSSLKLECNKATYECIQVERSEKGIIHFKGHSGKYWHVDSEGVTADSESPEGFYLELREPTRLCIKTSNGNYLTASKNGMFRLGDSSIENATQWEY